MSDQQPAGTNPVLPPQVVAEPARPEEGLPHEYVDKGMDAERVVYVEVFTL
jgi:hypothetical protein